VAALLGVVTPLAVTTGVPKISGDVPAIWERSEPPRTAEATTTRDQNTTPLNEEGIDVRRPMRRNLVWENGASYEAHIPAWQCQGVSLHQVVAHRCQQISPHQQDRVRENKPLLLTSSSKGNCRVHGVVKNKLSVVRCQHSIRTKGHYILVVGVHDVDSARTHWLASICRTIAHTASYAAQQANYIKWRASIACTYDPCTDIDEINSILMEQSRTQRGR